MKLERISRFRYLGCLRKPISNAVAADVRARSIVNFRVRSFKLNSLGKFEVAKKSITFLIFQINVYLGCGGLIL